MQQALQDALPKLNHGDHACLLFSSLPDQISMTVPFLTLGLERQERSVFVGAPDSIERLREGLKKAGVLVDQETQKGRLLLKSDRDYLNKDKFDAAKMLSVLQEVYDNALADGFTGLRAAGDVNWEVGPDKDFQDIVYYEALLDLFFLGKKMVGMCQYPTDRCPPETVSGILNSHKFTAVDASICSNYHYVPPDLLLEKNPRVREKKRVEWMTSQLVRAQKAKDARDKLVTELLREKNEHVQLLQAQKMEAVGRLAGGVAHDFNNLLTVILGNCMFVLKTLEEGHPLCEEVEEIRKSTERATALTRQLLAFSRKQIFIPKVISVNAVIEGLRKTFPPVLGQGIEFTARLAPNLGQIEADPAQIEQAIMSLAANACDAMPKGGKLTVETANINLEESYTGAHFQIKPGPFVVVSVTDTGQGMTRDIQERMFEPFFSTKEQRTGLGLAMVYGIVKQSKGYVWMYSEPGEGTVFKLYFPRVKGQLEEEEERDRAQARATGGSETVLLVEDESGVRKLARKILERQGYRVLEAHDGADALEVSAKFPDEIHLLLTDTMMPGLNGNALALRLILERPTIKVVYMSGYTDTTIIDKGILKSRVDFVEKPFTPDTLGRKVREALDRR